MDGTGGYWRMLVAKSNVVEGRTSAGETRTEQQQLPGYRAIHCTTQVLETPCSWKTNQKYSIESCQARGAQEPSGVGSVGVNK